MESELVTLAKEIMERHKDEHERAEWEHWLWNTYGEGNTDEEDEHGN